MDISKSWEAKIPKTNYLHDRIKIFTLSRLFTKGVKLSRGISIRYTVAHSIKAIDWCKNEGSI